MVKFLSDAELLWLKELKSSKWNGRARDSTALSKYFFVNPLNIIFPVDPSSDSTSCCRLITGSRSLTISSSFIGLPCKLLQMIVRLPTVYDRPDRKPNGQLKERTWQSAANWQCCGVSEFQWFPYSLCQTGAVCSQKPIKNNKCLKKPIDNNNVCAKKKKKKWLTNNKCPKKPIEKKWVPKKKSIKMQ